MMMAPVRMKTRGQRMLELLGGSTEPPVVAKKRRKKDNDIPDYVGMFDRGDWDSLDKILIKNKNLQNKVNKEKLTVKNKKYKKHKELQMKEEQNRPEEIHLEYQQMVVNENEEEDQDCLVELQTEYQEVITESDHVLQMEQNICNENLVEECQNCLDRIQNEYQEHIRNDNFVQIGQKIHNENQIECHLVVTNQKVAEEYPNCLDKMQTEYQEDIGNINVVQIEQNICNEKVMKGYQNCLDEIENEYQEDIRQDDVVQTEQDICKENPIECHQVVENGKIAEEYPNCLDKMQTEYQEDIGNINVVQIEQNICNEKVMKGYQNCLDEIQNEYQEDIRQDDVVQTEQDICKENPIECHQVVENGKIAEEYPNCLDTMQTEYQENIGNINVVQIEQNICNEKVMKGYQNCQDEIQNEYLEDIRNDDVVQIEQIIHNENKIECHLVVNKEGVAEEYQNCLDKMQTEYHEDRGIVNVVQIEQNIEESIKDAEEDFIEIASVAKYSSGKRRRTKLHFCKFCYKLIVGIGRHILTVHKDEMEVARIQASDKRNRKLLLEQIEREGDYNHNKEVIATGKGELILVRRPTTNELLTHTYEDYGPCTGCLGFMLKVHLWHHVKYGCKVTPTGTETPFSTRVGSEALLAAGIRQNYSPQFETHCIGKLVKDDVGKTCIKDETILSYGDYLFQKNLTIDPNQRANNVRSTMRTLGYLYLKIQEKLPLIKSFIEIFDPKYFNLIVTTVRNICEYEGLSKTSDLVSPSKAIRIGIDLIKMGEFVHGEHIMKGNLHMEKCIKKFIFLVKTQWNIRISSTARSTLEQRKFNNTDVLPLTSDIIKVNKYVQDICNSTKSILEKEINPSAYRNLSEALLTRIILFNKRRSGETSKLKIKQFLERGTWKKETTEELKSTLSQTEKDLAENLTLVYTKGKRKNKVPVLLTADMKELIELLIRVRNVHGIEKENPYLFARPFPAETPLRGHDCLRKMCENSGLTAIERVTGTQLRKYVATVSQVFNLTENETDWLAKHLGHDVRVHREFYRLHESALELTKVSRILLAIDNGKAHQFAGKKLNEINIDDLPGVEEEEEEEEVKEPTLTSIPDEEETKVVSPASQQQKTAMIDAKIISSSSNDGDNDYVPDDYDYLSDDNNEEITKKNKQRKTLKAVNTLKTPWTTDEKQAVFNFFRKTISERKPVHKVPAEKCIANNPCLEKRTWRNVRDFVRNHIRKISK